MAQDLDLVFHITHPIAAVQGGHFSVPLTAPSDNHLICICDIVSNSLYVRLSFVDKTNDFLEYSRFCLVVEDKIRSCSAISIRKSKASSVAGAMALSTTISGQSYRFSLLLQPRSREKPHEVGTTWVPWKSVATTAESSAKPNTTLVDPPPNVLFSPSNVIERSRDHSKVSPSRAVAQDGGQVWVFHITQPRRTAIHGKFDHELRAPQGDKLLCTCTVTPEEFKATLTSVNTSEIFKRFSALCIVINGMIEGVSQIGRDAQTATAIILPSTVTDGKYYRFSLLLQARFQKELLPTGRTFSIPRTARSSTITPPSLLPTKASLSPVLSSEDTDAGESHILESPLLLIANKSLPVKRKERNEAETSHPVAPLPHLPLSVTHSPIESEEDTKVGTTHTVASPPPMITRNSLVQDRGNTEAGSSGTVATPKTLGMVRDSPVQHKEEQTKARMTNAERTQSLLMALMANCSPFRSKDEETEPEPNRRVAPSIPSLPSHPPLTNRYSQVRSNTAFEDGTRAVSTTSAHSAAHFTGSVTDPPSGQSAALYIKSSSAPQPPPMPPVTVHFYHYDSCSNARNAVEASSEDLQPYCRIMEMVHKTYDFRRAMSPLYSCCSPLRSGEGRPAILLDMSFLEWEPLKIAIEYAHFKELTLGDVADRGEGVEMAYLDQVLEVMEVAGRLEMEDLVAACSAICMEH